MPLRGITLQNITTNLITLLRHFKVHRHIPLHYMTLHFITLLSIITLRDDRAWRTFTFGAMHMTYTES